MQGIANNPETDKRKNHPKIDRNIESLPGELWEDVKEWKGYALKEGYQVSNFGRVRNLGRIVMQKNRSGVVTPHPYPACMLRLTADTDGYLFTGLCTCSEKRKAVDARVHQLVAYYFITRHPRPDQFQVNHKDGNKTNNSVENLEWASPYENNKHARDNGLARLGTSQAIHGKVIEWNTIFESKTKTNSALGRYAGYIERCQANNIPIIDKNTGNEVHVEWIEREANDEYYAAK